MQNEVTGTVKCGENRWIPVQNILEFALYPDCTLHVEPINAIRSLIRMEWTLEGFYADGGSTTFASRLAASLGIPSYNIKVVSVLEGSVIVESFITAPTGSAEELTNLAESLSSQIKAGTIFLGAPILDASNDDNPILVSDSDQDGDNNNPGDNGNPDSGSDGDNKNPDGENKDGDDSALVSEGEEGGNKKFGVLGALVIVAAIIFLILSLVLLYLCVKKKMQDKTASIRTEEQSRHRRASVPAEEEDYEPQYHPKADLGDIYNNPDKIRAKINNADDVEEDDGQERANTNMVDGSGKEIMESTPLNSDRAHSPEFHMSGFHDSVLESRDV